MAKGYPIINFFLNPVSGARVMLPSLPDCHSFNFPTCLAKDSASKELFMIFHKMSDPVIAPEANPGTAGFRVFKLVPKSNGPWWAEELVDLGDRILFLSSKSREFISSSSISGRLSAHHSHDHNKNLERNWIYFAFMPPALQPYSSRQECGVFSLASRSIQSLAFPNIHSAVKFYYPCVWFATNPCTVLTPKPVSLMSHFVMQPDKGFNCKCLAGVVALVHSVLQLRLENDDTSSIAIGIPVILIKLGFSGTQNVSSLQKDEAWRVNVRIQGCDLENGYLCGTMEALNVPMADTPVVTFWEGEIVDTKNYTFFTEKWEATQDVDIRHWTKFPSFSALLSQVEVDGGKSLDLSNYPYIFMRWKEQYFVNVGTDCGLTIAGFYYVCFSCSDGSINGFYYDPNSSPFQKLELKSTNEGRLGFSFSSYELR
ncbi:hypothetical protein ABKV19_021379 [Rosa sericea]